MPTLAIKYERVSRSHQHIENQSLKLKSYCEVNDIEVVESYQDNGVSGDAGVREQYDLMIGRAKKGELPCKTILCYSISRWARSMKRCISDCMDLTDMGYNIIFVDENIQTGDKSNIYSRVILSLFSSLSECEVLQLRQRTADGIKRAREAGVRFGRPYASFDLNKAIQLREDGVSLRKSAKILGISPATLSKRYKELRSLSPSTQNLIRTQ